MKNKFSGSKVGKLFLALNCLILAILLWFAVEYMNLGELPPFTFFG